MSEAGRCQGTGENDGLIRENLKLPGSLGHGVRAMGDDDPGLITIGDGLPDERTIVHR